MITALALICSFDVITDCEVITKRTFFKSVLECQADLGNAMGYADSKGRYVASYRCVVWGEPA